MIATSILGKRLSAFALATTIFSLMIARAALAEPASAPQEGADKTPLGGAAMAVRRPGAAATSTRVVVGGLEGPAVDYGVAARLLGYVDLEEHFAEHAVAAAEKSDDKKDSKKKKEDAPVVDPDDRVLVTYRYDISPGGQTRIAALDGQPVHVFVEAGRLRVHRAGAEAEIAPAGGFVEIGPGVAHWIENADDAPATAIISALAHLPDRSSLPIQGE